MSDTLKAFFFDREAIASKLDPAIRKALSRFGAFVRQRDKSSIKYGTKSASPGQPPVAHRSKSFTKVKKNKKTGVSKNQQLSPLRELIFFAYEPDKKTVLIGPIVGGPQTPGILQTIEEGGHGHAAHPHTGTAFQAELGGAAGNFKDLIR
jgi:hypothetical protein